MTQLTMTGDDWTSDPDRRAQARAEAARKKTALDCARKLDAAIDGLRGFIHACDAVGDASVVRHAADGRLRMIEDLAEYSAYLSMRYGERA